MDCAVAAVGYKDFYQILGVSKNATTKEIKEKYRKLARQYHPDINKNKGAEDKFKDISEAYEVLGDDEKRRKYDQFGQYWNSAGAGGGNGFGGFEGGQYASFEEFINELLGRFGGGAAGGARGARTRSRSAGGPGFDFSDFGFGRGGPGAGGGNPFAGAGGNPFAGGAGNPFAGGAGNPFGGGPSGGPSQEPATTVKLDLASAFKGTSRVFRMPSASGRDESVTLDIPAGVFPGSKVRFGGKGPVNPMTGKKGDIMLNIELEPHPFFRLTKQESGNPSKVSWRLECDVQVSPDEAVLGGEIPVMTPNGPLDVTVPAGVRSGQFLRLRGKGWPDVRGGERGDLYVRVLIVPPPKGQMSDREKELYQELAKARAWDPRQGVSKYAL